MRELFSHFASRTAKTLGTAWAFLAAFMIVVVWAGSGPLFHYSDTWQLVINTGTTIITFLMVFLIQHTQNADARAMHLKLDELISAVKEAHDNMISIEELSDAELDRLAAQKKRSRDPDCAEAQEEMSATLASP